MITVATIAELISLPPQAGASVQVLGYHAPGDGGGGLFYADMDGARATDNGMVFGHVGDQMHAQRTAVTPTSFRNGIELGTNVVFGSVAIAPDDPAALAIRDRSLHGHKTNNGTGPAIDYRSGRLVTNDVRNYLTRRSCAATITYRALASPRRWLRSWDGRTVSARWFGLVPGLDETDALCWALNAAAGHGATGFRLDGTYHYSGPIELPELAFGAGRLIVAPDSAVEALRSDYRARYPQGRVRDILGGYGITVAPASGIRRLMLRDLELDGNYRGNLRPLTAPAEYAGDDHPDSIRLGLENALQNTPVWSGFAATNHGGRVIPTGQQIVLEDVHIHGFGSNCLVGHGNTLYHGRNVRVGNSARNHAFYSIQGEIFQLTVHGFAWAVHGKSEHLTVHGLRFENLSGFDFPAPWPAASQLVMYEGLRWSATPNEGSSAEHRFRRIGFNILGGHFDLAGFTANGPLIFAVGRHLTVRDLVVLGPYSGTGEVRLVSESESGNATLHDNWSFKNVTMLQRGGSRLAFASDKYVPAQLTVEDLSIGDLNGYEGASPGASSFLCRVYATTRRSGRIADLPLPMAFSRVRNAHPLQSLFRLDVLDAGATPVAITVRDSILDLSTSTIYSQAKGTGTIAGMTIRDLEKIAIVFDNVRFRMPASHFQNYELFFALTRFRNCRTFDGRVSEQRGTVTVPGPATVISIPTKLLWTPTCVRLLPTGGVTIESHAVTSLGADRRSPLIEVRTRGAGRLDWEADLS